jgi:hypothetical protein
LGYCQGGSLLQGKHIFSDFGPFLPSLLTGRISRFHGEEDWVRLIQGALGEKIDTRPWIEVSQRHRLLDRRGLLGPKPIAGEQHGKEARGEGQRPPVAAQPGSASGRSKPLGSIQRAFQGRLGDRLGTDLFDRGAKGFAELI